MTVNDCRTISSNYVAMGTVHMHLQPCTHLLAPWCRTAAEPVVSSPGGVLVMQSVLVVRLACLPIGVCVCVCVRVCVCVCGCYRVPTVYTPATVLKGGRAPSVGSVGPIGQPPWGSGDLHSLPQHARRG